VNQGTVGWICETYRPDTCKINIGSTRLGFTEQGYAVVVPAGQDFPVDVNECDGNIEVLYADDRVKEFSVNGVKYSNRGGVVGRNHTDKIWISKDFVEVTLCIGDFAYFRFCGKD